MNDVIEQQQARFEVMGELLQALSRQSGDALNSTARFALETLLTESALGAEDCQLALDAS